MNWKKYTQGSKVRWPESELDKRFVEILRDFAPMTKEEEVEEFRRYHDGDETALHRIIMSNQRMIVSMAERLGQPRVPISDMIQEGNIGMIMAAKNFDTGHGPRFVTYARWYVRLYMQRHILTSGYALSLPQGEYTKVQGVIAAWKKMAEAGEHTSIEAVCAKTGVSRSIVETARYMMNEDMSMDAKRGLFDNDKDTGTMHNFLSVSADPEQPAVADRRDMSRLVRLVLSITSREQRETIELLYGLCGQEPMSTGEVAEKRGVTHQSVKQTRDTALQRMARMYDIVNARDERRARHEGMLCKENLPKKVDG